MSVRGATLGAVRGYKNLSTKSGMRLSLSSAARTGSARHSWRRRRGASPAAAPSSTAPPPAPLHTIAFWSDQMCERGTEVALFDYADGAESELGYCSWVLYDAECERNFDGCIARFAARFGARIVGLCGFSEVDRFLAAHPEIAHLYQIKCDNDGRVSKRPGVRTYIHTVFDACDPYGDVYARISPCVPAVRPDGIPVKNVPVVPHIVRRFEADGPNLRGELGIPPDATVFGRYGGYESFDIDAAREAVLEIAREQARSSIHSQTDGTPTVPHRTDGRRVRAPMYFLFMNTPPLGEPLPHILHVAKTSDAARKAAFIRTCDAMIHARYVPLRARHARISHAPRLLCAESPLPSYASSRRPQFSQIWLACLLCTGAWARPLGSPSPNSPRPTAR